MPHQESKDKGEYGMAYYNTPFGTIEITHNQTYTIRQLSLQPDTMATTPLPPSLKSAFDNYFCGKTNSINVPTELVGTPFQCQVWRTLQTIPRGHTWTYGELANKLGSHPRAVGQACRHNPIPLIYPCHRVVSAKGIGGFAGEHTGKMIAIKQWLLAFEK